jgi:hypothetical protein
MVKTNRKFEISQKCVQTPSLEKNNMDDVEERDKLVVISHPRETNLDFGRAQQINKDIITANLGRRTKRTTKCLFSMGHDSSGQSAR